MNETFSNTFKSAEDSHQFAVALNAVRARKYIVGSMSEQGIFSISAKPVVHDNSASANAERTRLAKLNPGTSYITMQFCGGSLVPRVQGVAEF